MIDHKKLRQQFVDVLEQPANECIDIRESIISMKYSNVSVAYVGETLEKYYGSNLKNLFKNLSSLSDAGWDNNNVFMCTGCILDDKSISHKGVVKLFEKFDQTKKIYFIEQGFLASSHSWSHSFKYGDPKYACLGYVYDDISYYYMADYPNRLIQKLNSDDILDADALNRARTCIDRITDQYISKYNAQPIACPTMTSGYSRRVLVCDQAFADASTIYGKVTEQDFQDMLVAAIKENPDAEILVKTHPDSHWEKNRSGYYSHLNDFKNVRIIKEPVNPYSLFEHVDTVYVGTSGMGLEALLAGKKVVTFGVPFYAGWGLTDDRKEVRYRNRTRTLEEVFYYFYIWYTIYHLPFKDGVCEIEEVIDYIIKNRPVHLPIIDNKLAHPKISIILPVYGVEAYIKQCIESIQQQTLNEIEIIPVNDCSPDGSQKIIDELAASDPRIKPIILKSNVGQGFARNEGIKVAKGDYLWFMDSDDYLTSNDVLERLYESAISNNADLVRGRKSCERHENSIGEFKKNVADYSEKYFEEDILDTDFKHCFDLLYNRHFWLFLYKADFVKKNNISFVITQWEEKPFILKSLLSASKINLLNIPAVTYRVRETSTARREKNSRDFQLQLQNFEHVVSLLKEFKALEDSSPYFEHAKFILSQYLHYLVFGMCSRLSIESIVDVSYESLIQRIAFVFNSIEFQPCHISPKTQQINNYDYSDKRYHLLLSLIYRKDVDLIRLVRSGDSIDQIYLYQLYDKYSCDSEVLGYLNSYFRNEKVKTVKSRIDLVEKPKILIHIGSTKTGSTYIQHHLENNRPKLLEMGIYYPEVGLFWQKDRPEKQAGHAPFATAAIHGDKSLLNHVESTISYFEGKIHTVILSSEAFFLNPKSVELVNYFKNYACEMLVYLRRQDDWANSQYCEFVAGGAVGRVSLDIKEWLETDKVKGFLDYYGLLSHWSNKVGDSHIKVRAYKRSRLVNGDVLDDFSVATQLESILTLPRPSTNQQNDALLNANYVHILKRFNGLPFKNNRDDYLSFISEVINNLRELGTVTSEKVNLLSVNERLSILSKYKQGNLDISRRFGVEHLFDDVINDIPVSSPSTISVKEMDLILNAYFSNSNLLDEFEKIKIRLSNAYGRIDYLEKNLTKKHISLDSKSRSFSHSPVLINYGYWDWRLYLFKPLLRPFVVKLGNQKDLSSFDNDPYTFISSLKSSKYRFLGKLLFPQFSFYGPCNYLKLLSPVVAGHISKIDSEKEAKKFTENEVDYFRSLKNIKYKRVGYFLYPIGRKVDV
jgi:glycosyltransferase involved in cell wall biosynthesis